MFIKLLKAIDRQYTTSLNKDSVTQCLDICVLQQIKCFRENAEKSLKYAY